jgi:hypothetical protein
MTVDIRFPVRKIKVIHADIEIDVTVSDDEHAQMLTVFNEQNMNPLMKLTLRSPSGSVAEFTNLTLTGS